MRGLVYMTFRVKVDMDTFHKGIQYALEKLGKSKFGFERTAVSNFKSKGHEGSGNELVDYSIATCLGGLALVHTAQKDGHQFFTRLKRTATNFFFLSLKKEIIKMKGAAVQPRPLAPLTGMITTTLPASRLLKLENCKTIKRSEPLPLLFQKS